MFASSGKRLLTCFLLGLTCTQPQPAYAWALKKELRQARARELCLASKALSQRLIRYSLRVQPGFDDGDMQVEVEQALALWMESFPGSSVQRVEPGRSCDLRIEFGPRPRGDRSNGAFSAVERDCMLVHINTDHVWHENRGLPGNANGDYCWQPFSALANPGQSLSALIQSSRPLTLDQFARQRGLSHSTVFWTTYHTFLHEFGHCFGLADTNELLVVQSEPAMSSSTQPDSVMKTSNYFSLTADDRQGLQQAIQFVSASQPSKVGIFFSHSSVRRRPGK